MMYLWMSLEVCFVVVAVLLSLKGDIGQAIFTLVMALYAQNCRILEANKIRERMNHYGIRVGK
jgi:hypothetical protein